MESTTVIAEWHNPRLQQMKISPNAAAIDAKTKEKKLLTFRRPEVDQDFSKIPLHPLPTLK